MDADPGRPRFRFPVHPQAAGAVPRVRDRRQRSAQQGWGKLQPARHRRGNLAELRQPASAQCEDRRRGDGGPDRRSAPGQGDVAAVARALRRGGWHDLVPDAQSAAADGEQSAEGVLRHVRPGRYEGRAPGHSEHDGQPARLREGIDGQPEPQARCGRSRQGERLPGFGARDRAPRAEAREGRQGDRRSAGCAARSAGGFRRAPRHSVRNGRPGLADQSDQSGDDEDGRGSQHADVPEPERPRGVPPDVALGRIPGPRGQPED